MPCGVRNYPEPHLWQPTGRVDVHVEFPTKNNGRKQLIAHYVRCARCRQDGFQRPGSAVIYTWARDSAGQ